MRERVVGDLGTRATFVSNPSKTKKESNQTGRVTALRAEFVVTPGNETKVQETIERVMADSFYGDHGFLQALVLVSEMEARLVTLLTFWRSNGFEEARERRVARMRQKLLPLLDQYMRVQSFKAELIEGGTPFATNHLVGAEKSFSACTDAVAVI